MSDSFVEANWVFQGGLALLMPFDIDGKLVARIEGIVLLGEESLLGSGRGGGQGLGRVIFVGLALGASNPLGNGVVVGRGGYAVG